jgi:hypothetical protein
MFSFTGIVNSLDSKVWSGHVNVPVDIALELKKRKISRLVCTFNSQEKSHSALMSHGDGSYYILLNNARCKKLGLLIGSQVDVIIEADDSPYGMPMPEEMEELMRQDPEANKYFHALSPGKQRNLLYIIGKPKGSDTRLKKAIGICEYLKSVRGALDFRELNQALKDNRFKLK